MLNKGQKLLRFAIFQTKFQLPTQNQFHCQFLHFRQYIADLVYINKIKDFRDASKNFRVFEITFDLALKPFSCFEISVVSN